MGSVSDGTKSDRFGIRKVCYHIGTKSDRLRSDTVGLESERLRIREIRNQ